MLQCSCVAWFQACLAGVYGEGDREGVREEIDSETRESGRGFPSLLPSLLPLSLSSPIACYAGCAGYSVAINRGRGCVFVLNLVLALFHSVVLFCSDKISSFTARVRVSHRVSSTKL